MCLGASLETVKEVDGQKVEEQKEEQTGTSKPVATPARGANETHQILTQSETQETLPYNWEDDAWWKDQGYDGENHSSNSWVPSSWNSWGWQRWGWDTYHDEWQPEGQEGFVTPQRPSLRRGVSNISGLSDSLISSPDSSYLRRSTTTEQLEQQKHMKAILDLMPEGPNKQAMLALLGQAVAEPSEAATQVPANLEEQKQDDPPKGPAEEPTAAATQVPANKEEQKQDDPPNEPAEAPTAEATQVPAECEEQKQDDPAKAPAEAPTAEATQVPAKCEEQKQDDPAKAPAEAPTAAATQVPANKEEQKQDDPAKAPAEAPTAAAAQVPAQCEKEKQDDAAKAPAEAPTAEAPPAGSANKNDKQERQQGPSVAPAVATVEADGKRKANGEASTPKPKALKVDQEKAKETQVVEKGQDVETKDDKKDDEDTKEDRKAKQDEEKKKAAHAKYMRYYRSLTSQELN